MMIRLKTAHFVNAVSGPGENTPSHSQPPPNSRHSDYELQTDGTWVVIWRRGQPLPRLVHASNVRHCEPLDLPKAWVQPDFEGMDKTRNEAEAKALADARATAKTAAVAKAMAG